MKMLLVLLLGLGLGATGYWFVTEGQRRSPLERAREDLADRADAVGDRLRDGLGSLRPDDLREELSRTGRVVRERAAQAGEALVDATANWRITTKIKAKLLADRRLSAREIGVDTTDGLVTLSGLVATHEDLSRAIHLALETEGVRQVVSTIQVKDT